MNTHKNFTTGLLAFSWFLMLAILVTAFTFYPRGFLPALEFLGFPFILANVFLLAKFTAQHEHKDFHALSQDQIVKFYDTPHVQYDDSASFRPMNTAARYYAMKRKNVASRLLHT
jgi:hypothetical protein